MDKLPVKHCQNGRADICLAGAADGICCAEHECDIDEGIRKNPQNIICSVSLLYQKQDLGQVNQQLCGCFVDYEHGDDGFILKAKAEKYVSENKELSLQVKGMSVVAWHCVTAALP